MEKFSQFRDRGSGIAPFFPVSTQPAGIKLPFHIFLFVIRLPLLITAILTYFLILRWLPIGSAGKKASLWSILAIPGIWWIDLQIDGVRKGSLAKQAARLPGPSSIIASSSTSPIDALYLAAIFDPLFTASYPSTRLVHRISLFQAIVRAFAKPRVHPPPGAQLVDLETLLREHPKRVIAVFPECTTTNGRGILPFSPSLLTAPRNAKIFPLSLRYTPADITTPVPGSYFGFLWNLLSKPTHCIRVRIAESVYNTSQDPLPPAKNSYATNYLDTLQAEDRASSSDTLTGSDSGAELTSEERNLLDKVGEALARLGRVKRVALGVREKNDFVKAWSKLRR
ncbi:hypothetical protein L228DRAFT_157045 [Xylona heveae TC161]|uniref:Vacuolar protein sorting protein Vps66 n=1 Tax=Xylona heveae (strain CBS 132557 / TC161) TaxID=1328760 RepID=A0A165G292_XYLHT|nr:hypothetical protein L228DRAFT_157045 [Xylona heveae TC161]KZF21656.1 hypothetical protein L228DRAFT_157045 [Xylona heveae TC161]